MSYNRIILYDFMRKYEKVPEEPDAKTFEELKPEDKIRYLDILNSFYVKKEDVKKEDIKEDVKTS